MESEVARLRSTAAGGTPRPDAPMISFYRAANAGEQQKVHATPSLSHGNVLKKLTANIHGNRFWQKLLRGVVFGASKNEIVTVIPRCQPRRNARALTATLAVLGLEDRSNEAVRLGSDQEKRYCPCGAEHTTICFFPCKPGGGAIDAWVPLCDQCAPSVAAESTTLTQDEFRLIGQSAACGDDWNTTMRKLTSDSVRVPPLSAAHVAALIMTDTHDASAVDAASLTPYLMDFAPARSICG